MRSNNSKEPRCIGAGIYGPLRHMPAMGLGMAASPAEAAPFAYVANSVSNTVSVIDTATNMVVATVPAGVEPAGVAVTPDGKHAYLANQGTLSVPGTTVLVIDTTTNTVVATVGVGNFPSGVAITPDGTHVYVVNGFSNNVSVIDTASNTVVGTPIPVGKFPQSVALTPDGTHGFVVNEFSNNVSVIDTASNTVVGIPIPVGNFPIGVAITPNGTHGYVTNFDDNNVSVIDTATNKMVAAVAVGTFPFAVAVTPDGTHAYVTNEFSNNVSVIDTATNTVEAATLAVGSIPRGIAVTPDGKHAYVANAGSNNVSVIDTASNTVEVATIMVGNSPESVGIVPPPPGVPFLAFSAPVLEIAFGSAPNTDAFTLGTSFTLSSTAPAINPPTDAVTLQIGTFSITIPAGSFTKNHLGDFILTAVINGVTLEAVIKPTGTLRYAFQARGVNASFTGTTNTVYVTLAIGGDSGATSGTANIFGTAPSVTAATSH